jgi:hypothetical protein
MTHAGTALIESRMLSSVPHLALPVKLFFLLLLAWPAHAQTPCPGSDSCTGSNFSIRFYRTFEMR